MANRAAARGEAKESDQVCADRAVTFISSLYLGSASPSLRPDD